MAGRTACCHGGVARGDVCRPQAERGHRRLRVCSRAGHGAGVRSSSGVWAQRRVHDPGLCRAHAARLLPCACRRRPYGRGLPGGRSRRCRCNPHGQIGFGARRKRAFESPAAIQHAVQGAREGPRHHAPARRRQRRFNVSRGCARGIHRRLPCRRFSDRRHRQRIPLAEKPARRLGRAGRGTAVRQCARSRRSRRTNRSRAGRKSAVGRRGLHGSRRHARTFRQPGQHAGKAVPFAIAGRIVPGMSVHRPFSKARWGNSLRMPTGSSRLRAMPR